MTNPAEEYHLRKISQEWNWEMLRILGETPIETRGLSIVFDRRPDIFAIPRLFSERVECAGFFRGASLAGFAMLMFQSRYVNGEPRTVAYFGNAHVKREARGRGFANRSAGYLSREMRGVCDLGYAVVMAGNRAAGRFIGRDWPGQTEPVHSKVVATLRAKSILVMGRRGESDGYRVRHAEFADVDAVVGLLGDEFRARLFGPIVDRGSFLRNLSARPGCDLSQYYVAERGGRVVGTCAAWDTGGLKQNRIVRYGRKLKWLRKAHAAAAALLDLPPLPKEGGTTREATVTDCAVRGRDPEILEALLSRIHNDCAQKEYNLLIVGSCGQDPLLRATKRFLGQTTVSEIVLFSTDFSLLAEGRIDASLPYIDLAML
jgi:hypothetical protein